MSKSNNYELSHPQVIDALSAFIGKSGGQMSPPTGNRNVPRQVGLDVFTPYTPSRSPRLINRGSLLQEGVRSLNLVTVIGSDRFGNTSRIGVTQLAPVPNDATAWWSVLMIDYNSSQHAQRACQVGLAQNLPTAYFSELHNCGNEDVANALDGILNLERPARGLAGFSQAAKEFASGENLVFLCAPSSTQNDPQGLWQNAPRGQSRQMPQGPQSAQGAMLQANQGFFGGAISI